MFAGSLRLLIAHYLACFNDIQGALRTNVDQANFHDQFLTGDSALDVAKARGNQQIITMLQAKHNLTDGEKAGFKHGLENGFDAVDAIAQLLEEKVIQCPNIEDLCSWYCSFGPSSWERVSKFWKFYTSKKMTMK